MNPTPACAFKTSMRRAKLVLSGLAIGAALVLLTEDGRAAVRGALLRVELRHTSDAAARARTRDELLRLGHPAIDPVLPELATEEIDRLLGPDTAVLVARFVVIAETPAWNALAARAELERRHGHDPVFYYRLEEVLLDQPELAFAKRELVLMTGFPSSLAGRAFWKKESERELLLVKKTGSFAPDTELLLAVPLDGDEGPRVIEAVKALLGSRSGTRPRGGSSAPPLPAAR